MRGPRFNARMGRCRHCGEQLSKLLFWGRPPGGAANTVRCVNIYYVELSRPFVPSSAGAKASWKVLEALSVLYVMTAAHAYLY
ncbi:unnamed protein product, partial [Iphiclides podalirius]